MSGVVKEQIFIDGRWRDGRGAPMASQNPSTGADIFAVVSATVEDVDNAVAAARSAQSMWAMTSVEDRVAVMETYRDIGQAPQRLLAVGGGTKNRIWSQATSDICGIDQIICEKTIGASYGDAFLAALATGSAGPADIQQWNPVSETVASQPTEAYGQHYAYSFEGSPSANTLTSLHSKIELLSGVQTVKVRLKEGANKGEVIIFCEPIEGEQDAQFNVSSLKWLVSCRIIWMLTQKPTCGSIAAWLASANLIKASRFTSKLQQRSSGSRPII